MGYHTTVLAVLGPVAPVAGPFTCLYADPDAGNTTMKKINF
jgi:hypothetical protein